MEVNRGGGLMLNKDEFLEFAKSYFGYMDGGIELLGKIWDMFAVKIWDDTDMVVDEEYPSVSAEIHHSVRKSLYSFTLTEIALAVTDGRIILGNGK